jgi:hypothetical protein
MSVIVQQNMLKQNAILAQLTIPLNKLTNDQKHILGIPLDKDTKTKAIRRRRKKRKT